MLEDVKLYEVKNVEVFINQILKHGRELKNLDLDKICYDKEKIKNLLASHQEIYGGHSFDLERIDKYLFNKKVLGEISNEENEVLEYIAKYIISGHKEYKVYDSVNTKLNLLAKKENMKVSANNGKSYRFTNEKIKHIEDKKLQDIELKKYTNLILSNFDHAAKN